MSFELGKSRGKRAMVELVRMEVDESELPKNWRRLIEENFRYGFRLNIFSNN